jgi:hypothetical protein
MTSWRISRCSDVVVLQGTDGCPAFRNAYVSDSQGVELYAGVGLLRFAGALGEPTRRRRAISQRS